MGRSPEDPAAFVSAAERAVNSHDPDAAASLYASDAVLHWVTSEREERFEGAEAIRSAWREYLGDMRSAGVQVRKTIVSAEGDLLVNNYESSFSDGRTGGGMETWRFDCEGMVIEHHVYAARTRSPSRLAQTLGPLLAYPRLAVSLLKARRR